ncbi:recombinase family protein [Actinocorallia sp. API 0066]|uniref:recombinase family protein n=1 Tax=Actinocorallia sp. API 0066 TaxID=2896846 RepID=UPI001E3BBD24|nr:recombinase family protein [Actinocorallia sp. API 0066]MCD0448414.1 recombinase family protein [Actinocorallia sp. API 0066]
MSKPTRRPRVLGVVRLSNLTDTTSSPERQKNKISKWADLHDADVIGIAEDLDVSAITAGPWERPEFREWLNRPDDYDVIVAWKLDRLSRKMKDFCDLLEWAKKHKIRIVTVEESFDLGTPAGRMVAMVLAAFAEYEGEVIKERVRDAYDRNIKAGNWRGGNVPYGYRAVKAVDHWELEHDPETAAVMRDIISRMLKGESANSIVRDLNERKIPVSSDAQRIRQGKEPKGGLWRVGNLLKMLKSKALLGQYEAEGSEYVRDEVDETGAKKKIPRKVIVGDDGMPIQRAEPLITKQEWDALQEQLSKNSSGKTHHRTGGAPLRQVAFCAVCGAAMYRTKSRSMYYRCSSVGATSAKCGNASVKADYLENALETLLLGMFGKLERKTTVFIKGEDHTERLEQIRQTMDEVRAEKDRGDYRYSGGAEEYSARIQKLAEQRIKLEALPQVPSRTEIISTGETFADFWAGLSEWEKGSFYRQAGIEIRVLRWPGKVIVEEDTPNFEEISSGATFAVSTSFLGKTVHLCDITPEDNARKAEPAFAARFGDLSRIYGLATQPQAA